MRVGDTDGMNSVYKITALRDLAGFVVNFSGTLILESGEKILSFKTDSLLHIDGSSTRAKKGYPSFGGELTQFYPEAGWGTMFFTDRRIVFLRKPELGQLWEAYKGVENVGHIFDRAIEIHKRGAIEYLEVRYEDITGYEEGRYTVTIAISGTPYSDYELYLDKRNFSSIKPILERRQVAGRKRPLKRHGRLLVLLTLELALLAGIILKDDVWRVMFLLGFSILPLWLLLSYGSRPNLKTVKKNKWSQNRIAFLGTIIAFTVGVIFLALGIIATAMGGGLATLLVTLFMSSLMFGLAILARKEWRYHSINQRFVAYKYRCPNCGSMISRREIGCNRCGAVIWWLHFPKFRIRYHGRKPADDAWEKVTPQYEIP